MLQKTNHQQVNPLTHLQSCSQINVQFLTTLNSIVVSSLCREAAGDSSACATPNVIKNTNKRSIAACVGDCCEKKGKKNNFPEGVANFPISI